MTPTPEQAQDDGAREVRDAMLQAAFDAYLARQPKGNARCELLESLVRANQANDIDAILAAFPDIPASADLRARLEAMTRERDIARSNYKDEYNIVDQIWHALDLSEDERRQFRHISEWVASWKARATAAESALAEARAENAKLRDALQPFAIVGRLIDRYQTKRPDGEPFQSGCAWERNNVKETLTWGDLRRARAAIGNTP